MSNKNNNPTKAPNGKSNVKPTKARPSYEQLSMQLTEAREQITALKNKVASYSNYESALEKALNDVRNSETLIASLRTQLAMTEAQLNKIALNNSTSGGGANFVSTKNTTSKEKLNDQQTKHADNLYDLLSKSYDFSKSQFPYAAFAGWLKNSNAPGYSPMIIESLANYLHAKNVDQVTKARAKEDSHA